MFSFDKDIKANRFLLNRELAFILTLFLIVPGFYEKTIGQGTRGGVFITRNGVYEGRIGQSHILYDKTAGGVFSIVEGEWPALKTRASVETAFKVQDTHLKNTITVRQSFDHDPKILSLEEGNDRIGMRILYKLYDSSNVYYGHGMTETWSYPDGQTFVTQAVMFENELAYHAVSGAGIQINTFHKPVERDISLHSNLEMNDAHAPERFMFLTPAKPGEPRLALYWRTGRMEHDTYIYRSQFGEKGAPTYFRWPDYLRQAYTQLTMPHYIKKVDKAPWPPGRGAQIERIVTNKKGAEMIWPIDPKLQNPTASFNSIFRLAMVSDSGKIKSFVEAERKPVKLNISGGVIHGSIKNPQDMGYNDQEGCYEVRKTNAERLTIQLPENAEGQILRLKIVALSKHGGIRTLLNGKPIVPQLSSDGGIADDPLAPIRELPEGPANAALVTIPLTAKPQTLTVEETDGIQLAYQSRDPRRNFTIYSTHSGPRWSSLKFSLVDGHASNMRGYGKKDWAFTENLIHWYAWMGYSPEQMLDHLRDFEIIKNGPDEIVFKYTSHNANDGARSESVIRMSASSPAMQLNVSTTFTVLNDRWPYTSVQFFDGFPFRGVNPEEWWFSKVLYMNQDGKWSTYSNVNQVFQGDQTAANSTGTHFTALYSADRGNVLFLTKNFKSGDDLNINNVICSNYIDLHMNIMPPKLNKDSFVMKKGFQTSVEYQMAIWGDGSLTEEQVIQIGKKSLQSGNLAINE